MADKPLFRLHPRRVDVPALALLSLGGLGAGIWLPALTFENLFADDTFSVISGILGFLREGNVLLALMLLSFSVLFPIVKLLAILVLWFVPCDEGFRARVVFWLKVLGKWSMLDTFVIAVMIGAIELGILTEAVAERGIYVYFVAIFLSLVTTFLLARLVREPETGLEPPGLPGLPVTALGAAAYGIGLSLPLMTVEKWWFWENEYSVLSGLQRMAREDEWVLLFAVLAFVVVLPTGRFLGMLALRIFRPRGARPVRWLLALDKWSMADVFLLAFLVVVTKLGGLAEVTPRAGMWLLLAAGVLTVADTVLLHRAARS